MPGYGLYIHIPFCVSKCRYCDFVSFPGLTGYGEYIGALCRELEQVAKKRRLCFATVFIGGGTPSSLPTGAVKRVMERVFSLFTIQAGAEITIECNPGTLDLEKLQEYRQAGVNRLSLGVQSFQDGELRWLGRIHTSEEAENSLHIARGAGFDNINLDLMYGIPGQTEATFENTLQRACALKPEHISAYSLILEEGTPLFSAVKAGEQVLPGEDCEYEMHRLAVQLLQNNGYGRYEISNYAQAGFECRHNLNYWQYGQYIGVGIAAHSAILQEGGLLRRANTASMAEYLSRLGSGKLPAAEELVLPRDMMFEFVMLGLRTTQGISLAEFERLFGMSLEAAFNGAVGRLVQKGWAVCQGGRLRLTESGLDVQNMALMEF